MGGILHKILIITSVLLFEPDLTNKILPTCWEIPLYNWYIALLLWKTKIKNINNKTSVDILYWVSSIQFFVYLKFLNTTSCIKLLVQLGLSCIFLALLEIFLQNFYVSVYMTLVCTLKMWKSTLKITPEPYTCLFKHNFYLWNQ